MPLPVSLNNQLPVDLPVPTCSWIHATGKRDGEAEVVIPWNSAAYTATHLNREVTGFPVTVFGGRLGRWDGVCVKISGASEGMVLSCSSLTRLLKTKVVSRFRELRAFTPGAIVKAAFEQTFEQYSTSGLNLGTFAMLPPIIPYYLFEGQDLSTVVYGLMDFAANQEFRFDGTTFSWYPRSGKLYSEDSFVEGYHLTSPKRDVDFTDQKTLFIGRTSEGQEIFGRSLEGTGIWQPETIYDNTDDTTTRVRSMELAYEMLQRRLPKTSMRVGLRDVDTHWANLREGHVITCIAPTAGLVNHYSVWRVIGRSYEEGSSVLDLDLWHLPIPTGTGLAGIGLEIPQVVRPTDVAALNQIYGLIKNQERFRLISPLAPLPFGPFD